MAQIELNKVTNIITKNNGGVDYYTINPFDYKGNVGINLMSIVIELDEPWDGNTFVFIMPQISQIPLLNFQVNFTSFVNWTEYPSSFVVVAGNDYDNWNYGFIEQQGVMSWIPQSLEPIPLSDYGWWLVEQPNIAISPSPNMLLSRTMSEDITLVGGPEEFKKIMAKYK